MMCNINIGSGKPRTYSITSKGYRIPAGLAGSSIYFSRALICKNYSLGRSAERSASKIKDRRFKIYC